jgi:hypothetical protein
MRTFALPMGKERCPGLNSRILSSNLQIVGKRCAKAPEHGDRNGQRVFRWFILDLLQEFRIQPGWWMSISDMIVSI